MSYWVNILQRDVLISPEEVIFHSATDNNMDTRMVLQNIIIAEERFIAPAIGREFYEHFIESKNILCNTNNQVLVNALINQNRIRNQQSQLLLADTIIGNRYNCIDFVQDDDLMDLWNRFLWKITAEAVDVMLLVPSWLQTTSSGQQKNNPEVIGGNGQKSASGDLKDVQFKLNKAIQDRIDPLVAAMQLWICDKKKEDPTFLPLYKKCISNDCTDCGDENSKVDGISIGRKTGMIFDAYDDADKNDRNRIRRESF